MKILKPGRVEQRKFVCPRCGCEFVAVLGDTEWWGGQVLSCPTCAAELPWDNGEPYEEPTQDKTADRDEIIRILCGHCDANYSEAADVAQILIANGVTFREG